MLDLLFWGSSCESDLSIVLWWSFDSLEFIWNIPQLLLGDASSDSEGEEALPMLKLTDEEKRQLKGMRRVLG